MFRAITRLCGGEGAAVRVREVPRRRSGADDAHEVRGRGHGNRQQFRRGAAEGAAVAGAAQRDVQLGRARRGQGRFAGCLRAAARRPAGNRAPGPARWRVGYRGFGGQQHRPLVHRPDRWYRGTCGADPGRRHRRGRPGNRAGALRGQGRRVLRRAARPAHRQDRGRDPAYPPRGERAAGVPHGGHLRGGVRGPDPVPVLDL